jgi:transposase
MPWKECHIMDERLRFVARLLEGEKMAALCAEFGISRKTGYKIFDRYKDCGVQAFSDRSRRPHRQANRLPPQLEAVIVRLKREYPSWGAPKIREKLRRQSTAPHLPAISTVHAVLDRHGLVKRQRRRRHAATGTELSRPTEPNALWCADDKGEFMLGNRRYCYPLTITDFVSRYLLTCEALATTRRNSRSPSSSAPSKSLGCRSASGPTMGCRLPPRTRATAQQAVGLVAPVRHSDRADQTGPSATKGLRFILHLIWLIREKVAVSFDPKDDAPAF